MCKFCEFEKYKDFEEDIPADAAIVEDEVISFGVLGDGKQSLGLWNKNGVIDLSAWAALDGVYDGIMVTSRINYCPMCGRYLHSGHRYMVEASWIHPHKDSIGEYMDDLTYDQAMAVKREWEKDNVHKNVTFSKSELPFQGEGGNHGNQNTDEGDQG